MNSLLPSTRPLSTPSRMEFAVCRQRLILIELALALRAVGAWPDKEPSPFPQDESYGQIQRGDTEGESMKSRGIGEGRRKLEA